MGVDYLMYWKPTTAKREEGFLLKHAASDQYGSIQTGDTVWMVTAPNRNLELLGPIRVDSRTGKKEAKRRLGPDIWGAEYHIFAAKGDEECVRRVDISDIAELLRFESQIDRLKVMEGRVNPQQLQRMRRLTPGTVTILRSRWEEDKAIAVAIQEAQSALRRGAGYGQAASNREIEVAAVQHVTQLLRAEGWVITSVEVKCGLRSVVSEKGKAAARGG